MNSFLNQPRDSRGRFTRQGWTLGSDMAVVRKSIPSPPTSIWVSSFSKEVTWYWPSHEKQDYYIKFDANGKVAGYKISDSRKWNVATPPLTYTF